jgi:hypothetical protein
MDYKVMEGMFWYRGVLYTPVHSGINIDMMKSWKMRSSDVAVVTYGKSGIT